MSECKTHPLSFLLDDSGKFHKRTPGPINDLEGNNSLFVFEAGHRISAKHDREQDIDGVEELGVQSRYYNQLDSQTVESKGIGFSVETSFYSVHGVPVEYRTLRQYHGEKLISDSVFNHALDSGKVRGWIFN